MKNVEKLVTSLRICATLHQFRFQGQMHLQAKPYAKFIFDCRELLRGTLSWNVSIFGCCYVVNVFKNCYASRVSFII